MSTKSIKKFLLTIVFVLSIVSVMICCNSIFLVSGLERTSNHDLDISKKNFHPEKAESVELFIRGDVDNNRNIEMSDATWILRFLYIPGEFHPPCDDAMDVDDDGEIAMSDTVYLMKYLYVPGSPQPPAPFPECGIDPSQDDLNCGYHLCMGGSPFIRGDCNCDGEITQSDASCIMLPDPPYYHPCYDALDTNDNGYWEAADAIYLLRYLEGIGPPPPPPFPFCDLDYTEDDLDCLSYPPCESC